MLRIDPRNPRAQALHDALAARVDLDGLPDEVCVVFGGDGFMLTASGNSTRAGLPRTECRHAGLPVE